MKKLTYIFILLSIILSGCTENNSELTQYTRRTLTAGFDTEIVLIGYAYSETEFEGYYEIMRNEFLRYNEIFDNFREYEGINNLKTINDNAGIEPVVVPGELIEIFDDIHEYDSFNNDKFDPTLGAVLEIWHDYREQGMLANQEGNPGKVPPMELLEEANTKTGWELLEIDKEESTIYLNVEGASLDLGGIAKGWAVEQVARTLEEAGMTHGAINAGGNVRTINNKPDGPWRIGVARPSLLNNQSVDTITIDGSWSMVTSGDYQRFYTDEDENVLHHLIDPQTFMPSTYFRSVTVITPDSGVADLFSTILYLNDYQTGLEIIDDFNQTHPEQTLSAVWIIDKDIQAPSDDFFTLSDGEFQIALSENLRELSRAYQENQ